MGALTTADKEKIKRVIPKASNKIIDATAARLYIAYPNNDEWNYTGLSGAIVFCDDLVGHTFFLKLVDIVGNRGVLWDQELYVNFEYNQDRTFFHTFELDECYAGLLFDDLNDASHFLKRVKNRSKHGSKHTINNKNAIALKKNMKQEVAAPGPRGGPTGGMSTIDSDQRVRRTKGVLFYDDAPPPEWRPLYKELEQAGITEEMIADNREFIKDYISKQGGPLVGLEPPIPRKYQYKHRDEPTPSATPISTKTRKKAAPPPPPPSSSAAPSAPAIPSPAAATSDDNDGYDFSPPESYQSSRISTPGPPPPASGSPSPSPSPAATPAPAHRTFRVPPPSALPPPRATASPQAQQRPNMPIPASQTGRAVPPTPPARTNGNGLPPAPPARSAVPPAPPMRTGMPAPAAPPRAVPQVPQRTGGSAAVPPPPPPRRGNAPPPPPSRQPQIQQQSTPMPASAPPQIAQRPVPIAPEATGRAPMPIPTTNFPAPPQRTGASAVPSTGGAPPPAPPPMPQSMAAPTAAVPAAAAPPPPPPLPPQGSAAAPPPAPPPPPALPPMSDSGAGAPGPALSEATGDAGRDALLASIRGAGLGALKKVDKSQLEKPSPLLQEAKGEAPAATSNGGSSGGGIPGQPASLADALSAALAQRKGKVANSDDEDDDGDW